MWLTIVTSTSYPCTSDLLLRKYLMSHIIATGHIVRGTSKFSSQKLSNFLRHLYQHNFPMARLKNCHNFVLLMAYIVAQVIICCSVLNPICPLYNEELKNTYHLFFLCQATKTAWKAAYLHKWLLVDLLTLQYTHTSQFWSQLCKSISTSGMDRVVALMWSIWKSRNSFAFHNESFNFIPTVL